MARKLGVVVAWLALTVGGCATASQLEDQARVHNLRADAAAERGDYETAAHEKREAGELHAKAVERAYKQGETARVEIPADVPQSPKGY